MIKYFQILFLALLLVNCKSETQESKSSATSTENNVVTENASDYALVIHGGAGTMKKSEMTEELESKYKAALGNALLVGQEILKKGGSSTDAVVEVIKLLEDDPLFNAGRGSVFTHEGRNEMDASIMVGTGQKAGAVGGVTNVKNPIEAARMVMDSRKHVMMVGKGAETFAKAKGLNIVDPSFFFTQRRYDVLKNVQKAEARKKEAVPDSKYGTVGCVALDKKGVITAGTSTGGMTNKRYNRVGDSPIIGAGTYANANYGISCTGHGEYFIRFTVARDIAARAEYLNQSLQESAEYVVNDLLVKEGGDGGVIGLDRKGNIVMPFNTSGMYRGYANDKEIVVKIFKED